MPRRAASVLVALAVSVLPASAGVVAVKAGLLIDGTGAPPRKDPVVLVEKGKILAVGTLVPTGAETIDLGKRTLLPGFIDAHVHLTGRTLAERKNRSDASGRDLPQEDAIRGVRNAERTLRAGFTTVRNVGASDFSDIALRDTIREGVVPGPRVVAAGHVVGVAGGRCGDGGYAPAKPATDPEHGAAGGPAAIVEAVRDQVQNGADVIAACASGYSEAELKILADTAHAERRRVAVAAFGASEIDAAVRAGADSIEHGWRIDDGGIALMKEKGTFLVPTLMAREAVAAAPGDANVRKAIAGGVRIALGSGAGVCPHGANGHEFALLVGEGMKPMDAIVAGTRDAAELLGLGKEVGTVEAGKVADLVAVDGDPLQDIGALESPAFVMHEGTVIVRPKKKAKKGLAKLFSRK